MTQKNELKMTGCVVGVTPAYPGTEWGKEIANLAIEVNVPTDNPANPDGSPQTIPTTVTIPTKGDILPYGAEVEIVIKVKTTN